MEELMKKLINITSSKFSRTIKASSNTSDFKITFPIPLVLDKELNYELGLMWFSTYNTIYNITTRNNLFRYSNDGGTTFQEFKLNPGAYEIKDINAELPSLEILPQLSTGKILIKQSEKQKEVIVDFTPENSMHNVLGFEKKKYKGVTITSPNLARITNVLDINIECDLVNGNYSNGKIDNILYSFPGNTVPLGYKIIERMNPPKYLPITRKVINDIHIRILDQDGEVINFNREMINLYLDLKQV